MRERGEKVIIKTVIWENELSGSCDFNRKSTISLVMYEARARTATMNQHILITVALLLVASHTEAACKGYPNRATGKALFFKCDNVDNSALNDFPNDTTSIFLENVSLEHITKTMFLNFTKLEDSGCKWCSTKWIDYMAFSDVPKLR